MVTRSTCSRWVYALIMAGIVGSGCSDSYIDVWGQSPNSGCQDMWVGNSCFNGNDGAVSDAVTFGELGVARDSGVHTGDCNVAQARDSDVAQAGDSGVQKRDSDVATSEDSGILAGDSGGCHVLADSGSSSEDSGCQCNCPCH